MNEKFNRALDGEIFIVSTDTVPGIGGILIDEVRDKIFKIKNRPTSKKLIIMISSIKMLKTIENITLEEEKFLIEKWPSNITYIINDVGYRIPNERKLIELIEYIGPIYMTSANKSGSKIKEFNEAIKEFKNIKLHFKFNSTLSKPSKIIDLRTKKVLRE